MKENREMLVQSLSPGDATFAKTFKKVSRGDPGGQLTQNFGAPRGREFVTLLLGDVEAGKSWVDVEKMLNELGFYRQLPPDRYTCIGKGGQYEKLGYANPAGAIKAVQGDSGLMVYRDTESGALYFRDPRDFQIRMTKVDEAAIGGE